MSDPLLSALEHEPHASRIYGVVVGVVTNVNDPEQLGRVRLKFPWLDERLESNWARVLAPLAGNGHGLQLHPEVNDEVLVAFEHGVVEYPYVIGALWNGVDKAPLPAVENGKVLQRGLTTPGGHKIVFEEGRDKGKGAIEITTARGRTLRISDKDGRIELRSQRQKIILDDDGQQVQIEVDGSLSLSATKEIKLAVGGASLTISASGGVKIGAAAASAEVAPTGVKLAFAASAVTLDGGGGKLEGVPTATVKGPIVQLNPPG